MASLIYHAGALGDFVTTLPAMALWKADHPGERLILLGRPEHGRLAAHLFDAAWDAGTAEFARLFSRDEAAEPSPAPRAGRTPDLRFSGIASALLFAAESSPLPEAIRRLGVNEVVRQDPFPGSTMHVVDYHLGLFEGRVRDEDRVPRLPVGGSGSMKRGIALHAGSGSPRKNWPLERFRELAEALARRGEAVTWIVGPAEEDQLPRDTEDVWKRLLLPELAARIAGCRLFVGNDSGVSHLAAAAGCSTVALFGASDYRVWSPRGPRVAVVPSASGRMEDITVEDVLRVCLDLL
jgi:ADP-heptose:LPS heptosyltransferase